MSGDKSYQLNERECRAIDKLREYLGDVLTPIHTDVRLLQFLQARDNNVCKAADMFRKSLEWRKTTGADTILNDYTAPEVLKKYFMGGIIGSDKDGAVLIVQAFGKMDFRGLLKSCPKAEIMRYHAFLNESIYHTFRKNPRNMGRESGVVTSIMDMEGFSLKSTLWKPGLQLFAELVSYIEDNYPGTANKVFVINVPMFFPVGYKLLYPFFSPRTRSTIEILGYDYKNVLLRHIASDQLPAIYGGTKYGPEDDPSCADKICYCGEVPESFYMKLDDTNSTQLVIHRPVKEHVLVQISKPNAILRWRINTDGHDVDFGVTMRVADGRPPIDVLTTRRVASHFVPECGSVTCERIGTYVLTFDISFSWVRKRTILYVVEVVDSIPK